MWVIGESLCAEERRGGVEIEVRGKIIRWVVCAECADWSFAWGSAEKGRDRGACERLVWTIIKYREGIQVNFEAFETILYLEPALDTFKFLA